MTDTPTVAKATTVRGIPPLDGLRGAAAVLVLLTHVGFITGSYAQGGLGAALARFDLGVALFFVLSGFLLTRPWVAAHATAPSVRTYVRRRAARILPAYWLALVAVLLTAGSGASGGAVLSNATLTQVYTGDFLEGFTQTWSLCTEVAFYLLLPFLAPAIARLARRNLRRSLVVLGVGALLSYAWAAFVASDLTAVPRLGALWLPGHLDWFLAGLALAVLEPRLRADSRIARWTSGVLAAPWSIVALAVALFALACTPVAGPLTLVPPTPLAAVTKELLYCVIAALLVFAAAFAPPQTSLARAMGGQAGRALGRVSYGVFLWHLLIIDAVVRILGLEPFTGNPVVVGLLGLVGTYIAAELSWHLVERPVLRHAGAHIR